MAASLDDDRPYAGDQPPVRLTDAPLLFATTLSLALGFMTQHGAADQDAPASDEPDTDPMPLSEGPSTERMVEPPAW